MYAFYAAAAAFFGFFVPYFDRLVCLFPTPPYKEGILLAIAFCKLPDKPQYLAIIS